MESSTPTATTSLFSLETMMMPDLQTLTQHLSIDEENQQRQIDSFSHTQSAILLLENHHHCTRLHTSEEYLINSGQDDSNCQGQMKTKDMATAPIGFIDTQISSVVNTTVAGQSQSTLPSPLTSSSLSSSLSFATAVSKPADIPKLVAIQPHSKSVTKSSSATKSTTLDTTTTSIPSTRSSSSTKKPSVKLSINKKSPVKSTTKTSSKPTKQIQKPPSQNSASTMVQTSIDKFVINRKASIATARRTVVSGTNKSTSVKPNLMNTATTRSSSSTNNQPPVLTTTTTIKPISATSPSSTTTTTPVKPKPRVKAKSPTNSSPSTKATKAIESTASSPVAKKHGLALQKTTKTSPSPPRLKANFFFGLLPPPTISTVTRKPGESPKCETESKSVGDSKKPPKAGPGVSSVSSATDAITVVSKSTKIRNPLPESNVPTATAITAATASNSSSSLTRTTTATTTAAKLAAIEKTLPPEVLRQVVKLKSSLPEIKDATTAAKTGSERPAVPTNIVTPPSASKETDVPIEISNRVTIIKSFAPKTKVGPATAVPTITPVAPNTLAPSCTAVASPEASTKTVSKTAKIPLTSTNITTAASVSKTKAQPSPVLKSVIVPAAEPKKTDDNTSKGSGDTVSFTTTTTITTAAAAVVAKNKVTSKDTTASKSSSKNLTTPKIPKSASTTLTITTNATTVSVPQNSISILKPSKNLTNSITTVSKNKNNNKDKDSLCVTASEIETVTKPIAQPRRPATSQQQLPSAPLQPFTILSTSTFGILPSPVSLLWPNEDVSMDYPSTATFSPHPPPPPPPPPPHPPSLYHYNNIPKALLVHVQNAS
ncbi:hypothetical protein BGZ47_011419 [Haplosporangium gracile]|nr:hypothetical protein BGZ47_011419 [Haplosporangium gracile]